MGLTTFKGSRVQKSDITTAKNYLSEAELKQLNLIVDQYLSFAEFQAQQRKPMHMADWRRKLDDFLRLNERDVLSHAGKISAKLAEEFALKEFDKFQAQQKQFEAQNPVSDFDKAIERLKKLPETKKKRRDDH